MRLRVLDDRFGVLKLTPPQPFPVWLADAPVFFLARTEDEYSIICPERCIPDGIAASTGYRCLRVDGDLAFDAVGVVARVSSPLAAAGLSLFLVSTHDRDYVLVRQDDLARASSIYREHGFTVMDDDDGPTA